MADVVVEDAPGGEAPDGLVRMVAELLRANLHADPAKGRIVESTRGAVQIDVADAALTIGLKFVPGTVTVTSGPVPGADLHVRTDAETLVSLSTVPLRFGLPDPTTGAGRAVGAKLFTGSLKITGLPLALPMLRRLNRLLSVTAGTSGSENEAVSA